VVSLESEKPTTDSDPFKTRIRLIGAARRRYKKQQQEREQAEKIRSLSAVVETVVMGKGGCKKTHQAGAQYYQPIRRSPRQET